MNLPEIFNVEIKNVKKSQKLELDLFVVQLVRCTIA